MCYNAGWDNIIIRAGTDDALRGQILMNTARKLILLFSLLAVAMTAANSLYFYNASIADLDRSTQ